MSTQPIEETDSRLLRMHLEIAVRNGILLSVLTFVMGCTAIWAVMHWQSAPWGAVFGAALSLCVAGWAVRVWVITKGVLNRP